MQNLRIEKLKNLSLAALLMAGAAFTACSSSSDEITDKQPENPTTPKVYTLVIKASKGDASREQNGTRSNSAEAQFALGEAKGGDTTTRALKEGTSGIDAYWSGTETIEVKQDGVNIGSATAKASPDGNTTITATLTSAPDPTKDLNFYLGGSNIDYTGQVGLLTGTGSISEKYDYVESLIYSNAYTVEGYNVIPGEFTTLDFSLGVTNQAIIKFTLQDKANDAAISPSALTVTDGTSTVSLTSIPDATYTANGDGVLYVAFPAAGSAKTITLTATVGDDTYTYTTSSAKTFYCGQYYPITVKMTKQAPAAPSLADAFVNGNTTALAFTVSSIFMSGDLSLSATYNSGFGDVTKGGTMASMVTSASMAKDGNNLVVTVTAGGNTGSMIIDTDNNTYTWTNATVGAMITLSAITIGGNSITPLPTAATTVTWNSSNCSTMGVISGPGNTTIADVQLSCNAEYINAVWDDLGYGSGINFRIDMPDESDGYTFTAPSGKKFTKIEMTVNSLDGWYDAVSNSQLGSGWPSGEEAADQMTNKVTWTGTAASTVDLLTGVDDFLNSGAVTSIVFTLVDAE